MLPDKHPIVLASPPKKLMLFELQTLLNTHPIVLASRPKKLTLSAPQIPAVVATQELKTSCSHPQKSSNTHAPIRQFHKVSISKGP
jgi:hypothetical protein